MSKKHWVTGVVVGTLLSVAGCSSDTKSEGGKFKEPDGLPQMKERPAPGAPGPGPAPKGGSTNTPRGAQ